MQQQGSGQSVGVGIAPPHPTSEKQPFWRGAIDAFTRRLIDFNTLSWPLRLAVGAAVATIVVTSGLLLLKSAPQPIIQINSGSASPVFLPVSSLVFIYLSFALAWSLVLTGALHAHVGVRFIALLVASVILGFEPLTAVLIGLSPYLLIPALLQCAAIAGLWIWGGGLTLLAMRSGPEGHRRLAGVTFAIVAVLQLVYFIPDLFFSVYLHDIGSFTVGLGVQLLFLQLLLLPVLFVTGSDLAESAEVAVGRVAFLLRRLPWSWLVAVPTVALALVIVIVFVGRLDIVSHPAKLEALLILLLPYVAAMALVFALVRFGRFERWPARPFPASALLATGVSYEVALFLSAALQRLSAVQVALALLFVVIGVVLILSVRQAPTNLAQVGLFLVFFGLVLSLTALSSGFVSLLTGSTREQPGVLSVAPILLALTTLYLVVWLILRGRRFPHPEHALGLLFVANASLLAIVWLFNRYTDGPSNVTFTLGQALLVMGAFLWDLLTSGEQITNRDGPRFPRYARVLIYSGYIVLLAAELLFVSSQIVPANGEPLTFNSDSESHFGLIALGAPLLLTLFLVKWGRWSSGRDPEHEEVPPSSVTPQASMYVPPQPPRQWLPPNYPQAPYPAPPNPPQYPWTPQPPRR